MSAGDALRRVEAALTARGLKRAANGRYPCPAHGGTDPNLALAQGKQGAVLTCHSRGCDGRSIARDIGLTVAQLFDDWQPQMMSAPGTTQRSEYVYRDESGAPLYRTVRLDYADGRDKRIWQERYDPASGEFRGKLEDVRRVLYRVTDVQRAVAAGARVYVVEGERTCDALREACGVTVTTAPQGAGQWRNKYASPSYAEWLRGADVVLLPDNDDKGRAHMATAAEALRGVAASVRVVELTNLPPKGDAVEWLEAGGTRETLEALVEATTPEPAPEASAPVALPADRFHVVRLSDVEPEPVHWLWPGRLALGKLALVEGDPGKGKSTFTYAVTAATTRGIPLPDAEALPPMDVVIVTYEDGLADTLRPRLDAAGADVSRVHAIQGVIPKGSTDERLIRFPDDAAGVFDVVTRVGAKLVIIDPLSASLGGDTDSYKETDMRRVLAPIARFAETTGAAVLVVRHLTKSAGRAITSGGGSIAIAAAARTVLAVHEDPDDRERRVLAVVKNNLAAHAPSLTFRLAPHENGCARIEWLGESHHTADALSLLRGETESPAAERELDEWLRDALSGGPVDRKELLKRATESGFPPRSVDRAAQRLGVRRQQSGFGKEKHSEWSLPSAPSPATCSRACGNGAIGGIGADAPEPTFGCPTCSRKFFDDPGEPGDARCFLCRRANVAAA